MDLSSQYQNNSTFNNNELGKNDSDCLPQKFDLPENAADVETGRPRPSRLTRETCGRSPWNSATFGIIDGEFIGGGAETNNGLTSIIYGHDKNSDDENNNDTLGKTQSAKDGEKLGPNPICKRGKASRIPIRKGRKNVFIKEPAPKSFRDRSRGQKTPMSVKLSPSGQNDLKETFICDESLSQCEETSAEAHLDLWKFEQMSPPAETVRPSPETVADDLIIEAPPQFLDHSAEPPPPPPQEGRGFPGNAAAAVSMPEAARPTETGSAASIPGIPNEATEQIFNNNTEDISYSSAEIHNFELDFSNLSSSHSSLSIDFELISMNGIQLESPSQDTLGYPRPAKRLSLLSPSRLTPVEFDRKSPDVPPRTIISDKCAKDLSAIFNSENASLISKKGGNENTDLANNNDTHNLNITNCFQDNIDMLIPSEGLLDVKNNDLIMDSPEKYSGNNFLANGHSSSDVVDSICLPNLLENIADSPKIADYDSFVFRSISSSDTSNIMDVETGEENRNQVEHSELKRCEKTDQLKVVSVENSVSGNGKSEVIGDRDQKCGSYELGKDFQPDNCFGVESNNEAGPEEGATADGGRRDASIAPAPGAPPLAVATPPPPPPPGSRCEVARDDAAAATHRDGPQARARPPHAAAAAAAAAGGLSWRFRADGRLVFDEGGEEAPPLTSRWGGERAPEVHRHLNKRCESSRLKPLEHKLKQAGITDGYFEHAGAQPDPTCNPQPDSTRNPQPDATCHPQPDVTDHPQPDGRAQPARPNNAYDDEDDLLPELSDGDGDEPCEFDASAFLRASSSSSDDDGSDDGYVVVRRRAGAMRDADAAAKHNPDKDNLRSLLKKPGGGRQRERRPNRVVFNETKNEFFDADYIILIREECCAEYDDEDDDDCEEPCTCHRPELVRLPCCEPGCGCGAAAAAAAAGEPPQPPQPQPPSPKFAPPPEFVDAVALSPPEGYKDMEGLERRGGGGGGAGAPVCRECSQGHAADDDGDDGEGSQSDTEAECRCEDIGEREKTDQSQQTTPTTPPEESGPINRGYGSGGEMATTGAAQVPPSGGSPVAGILKGGRLWRQQTIEGAQQRVAEPLQAQSSDSAPSDDDCGPNRRSVRFTESENSALNAVRTRDECDGAPGSPPAEPAAHAHDADALKPEAAAAGGGGGGASPDSTEMTLTFRLGHHVLISNNSLKPNSAVRQLFPCAKVDGEQQQYLVTAESLRAFEEAKRAKLPQLLQGEADESIRRAIERNALRRSLIRYEARGRKQPYKADNSLVERIKQLTCDVDNDVVDENGSKDSSTDAGEDLPDSRASPPGEEARNSPEVNQLVNKNPDKSFSPSSSSTTSSSSMSSSSTLNRNRPDNLPDIQNNIRREKPSTLPDIGGPHHNHPLSIATHPDLAAAVASRAGAAVDGPRRQFLQATLAPLTACVGVGVGVAGAGEEYYYQLSGQAQQQGDRASLASSGGGTDYSLEDIDEALREVERRPAAPDVVAGTPAAPDPPQLLPPNANNAHNATATTANDELAAFVKRDAGRIERIRKKYQPEQGAATPRGPAADDDDEHDDYGFSRRPSVRGIKPRFGTTTEILQQIQSQLQQPAGAQAPGQPAPAQAQQQPRAAWPYYSEQQPDNAKRGANQNYAYVVPGQYRAAGATADDGLYQNCGGQRCVREVYRSNVNTYSTVVRVGCNDYYASLPRQRNGRPQSPPPTDVSRQYHQTMVYIPYDRIEGYQPGTAPVPYYHAADYARVANQNQINKRYVAAPAYGPPGRPPPYCDGQPPPAHHHPPSRGGSPLPGQLATARGTQTPAPPLPPPAANCGYYQAPPRYRPMVGPAWPSDGGYITKVNRHSFPAGLARYPGSDSASLTDSDSQHSGQLPNGFRQSADLSHHYQKEHAYQRDSAPGSPTKPRFIERGVPEGAASVSPQDGVGVGGGAGQATSGTMTSPTSPQNPPPPAQKPLFYAMNV